MASSVVSVEASTTTNRNERNDEDDVEELEPSSLDWVKLMLKIVIAQQHQAQVLRLTSIISDCYEK